MQGRPCISPGGAVVPGRVSSRLASVGSPLEATAWVQDWPGGPHTVRRLEHLGRWGAVQDLSFTDEATSAQADGMILAERSVQACLRSPDCSVESRRSSVSCLAVLGGKMEDGSPLGAAYRQRQWPRGIPARRPRWSWWCTSCPSTWPRHLPWSSRSPLLQARLNP